MCCHRLSAATNVSSFDKRQSSLQSRNKHLINRLRVILIRTSSVASKPVLIQLEERSFFSFPMWKCWLGGGGIMWRSRLYKTSFVRLKKAVWAPHWLRSRIILLNVCPPPPPLYSPSPSPPNLFKQLDQVPHIVT